MRDARHNPASRTDREIGLVRALRVDHLVEWSLALLALDVLPDARVPG